MDEQISQVIAEILSTAADHLSQSMSARTLDDVTFHDFAKYEFLLNPADYQRVDVSPLTPGAVQYMNDLENTGASLEVLEYMADLLARLESSVRRGFFEGLPVDSPAKPNLPINSPQISTTDILPGLILRPLYTLHRRLLRKIINLDRAIPNFLSFHLVHDIRSKAKSIAIAAFETLSLTGQGYGKPLYDWVFFVEGVNWEYITPTLSIEEVDLAPDLEYPYEFYPPGSVNVGVAIIYRQRWKTIGIQPGEIVKTIPLGPGQSEKVITKITRRRKTSSSREMSIESETTTESSNATKDSTEIVNEAASKENWSLSANVGYGVGGVGFGASVSGEMSGSKEHSSKAASSSLSEMMKKTASKIRRQTKVTVNTETEAGFEATTTSEVTNPNDGVAMTLQYHMLQHQYEVYTYLFSVRNALFVAERVPAPYEINLDWIRRYDWIIAEELLDDSFRSILNELVQDADLDGLVEFSGANDQYSSMLAKAKSNFARFEAPITGNSLGGLDVPDIYAEPLRQYDQFRKGEAERQRENKIREIRRNRLLNHIRDNILHYCRAIWAREDSEQRLLRYRREGRTVPFIWQGPLVQNELNAAQFEPTEIRVALGDLITDISPIGFTGNYVVFDLAVLDQDPEGLITVNADTPEGEIRLPVHEVLDIVRSAYTNPQGTALRDPAQDLFMDEAEELLAADPNALRVIPDEVVFDLASFLPRLEQALIDAEGAVLRDPGGSLQYALSADEWAEFQFKKNATRRFLVDSNNLYLSLLLGNGSALEPFKRAHRFIDVLKADEERKAEILKNERRELLKAEPNGFDPDIAKVVIASGLNSEALAGGLLDDDDDDEDA